MMPVSRSVTDCATMDDVFKNATNASAVNPSEFRKLIVAVPARTIASKKGAAVAAPLAFVNG